MRALLLSIAAFLFCGCATNTTPLAKSFNQVATIADNSIDTVVSLVENSTGIDPATKKKILEKAALEKKKVAALKESTFALLEEMGKIDWEQIIRDELKEVDTDALLKELLEILKKKMGV